MAHTASQYWPGSPSNRLSTPGNGETAFTIFGSPACLYWARRLFDVYRAGGMQMSETTPPRGNLALNLLNSSSCWALESCLLCCASTEMVKPLVNPSKRSEGFFSSEPSPPFYQFRSNFQHHSTIGIIFGPYISILFQFIDISYKFLY